MAEEIYGFDAESVRWLRLLVQERRAKQGDAPTRQLPNWQHVRITGDAIEFTGSGSNGSGSYAVGIYYPGIVVKFDAARQEELALGECWVKDWNAADLFTGTRYDAQQTGNINLDIDGSGSGTTFSFRPLFMTAETTGLALDNGSGSGSGDLDGVPISDLFNCDPVEGAQVRNGQLAIRNGRLVLIDPSGEIISGG
jgi:hypothetical protein